MKEVGNTIIVLGAIAMCITILYRNLDVLGNEQVYNPPAEGILLDEASMGIPLLGLAENEDYELLQVTEQGYLLCEDVDKNVFKLVPREK